MSFEKIKRQAQLLEKITAAIKEAKAAGVRNPLEVLKKALEKRAEFKAWKPSKKK